MQPATVKLSGAGLRMAETDGHPACILFSGGYDVQRNTLFLASVMGHPRGVSLAGGDPSGEHAAGLRIVIVASGAIYWATDSMSLPRGLNESESEAVQAGLELQFPNQPVRRVEKLEDVPR